MSSETTGQPPASEASCLHVSSPVMILGGPSPAASALTRRLRTLDVKVLHTAGAESALNHAAEEEPQVLVVDARTGRRPDRLEELVKDLRDAQQSLGALWWFDADAEDAEILRLCRASDDHMTGSIDVDETLRRLHLLTGRLPRRREGERLVVGDLVLDTSARTVTRAGEDIDLSGTEFRLLRLLMRHARTVLPKAEILQNVWEYEFAGQANIVELYISYLRKKIEAERPRMIHTVRGAGYVLRPAEGAELPEVHHDARQEGEDAADPRIITDQ